MAFETPFRLPPALTHGLGSRASLPLILAGPILRHVDDKAVTVWVALKEASSVALQLFDGATSLVLSAAVTPTKLGSHLFVALVTAKVPLVPGKVYTYTLNFQGGSVSGDLLKKGILVTTDSPEDPVALLSYGTLGKPSFTLPAATIDGLRIAHGSCRKPHGDSLDALAMLNDMLTQTATQANSRPQQLILTGDQIYADEVSQVLMASVMDAASFLFDQKELLPNEKAGEPTFDAGNGPPPKPGPTENWTQAPA